MKISPAAPLGIKEVTIEDVLEWLADNVDDDPWCNDVADLLLDMDDYEADKMVDLIVNLTPEAAYVKIIEVTGAIYRPHFIQCKFP